MDTAIQLENVTAGYKNTEVLRKISFSVPSSGFCSVIGPNGSGKSTLLKTITGLIKPAQGTVRLFGEDVSSLAPERRAGFAGVVPQAMETPMAFTVSEMVMIGRTAAMSRWKSPSKKDVQIAERAMIYTDVADIKNKLFTELSGGERQRTVIAMVLAQEPRIILLDEATSHLDINHRLEVMQIVERLNREQGVTILMVSHDLTLAAEFSNNLILLDHGQLVSQGAPSDVLNENTLRKVYHCNIDVRKNPSSGSITVTPSPRLTPGRSGRGIKVHVIAGGGCGEEILRWLSLCEYSITCGVLNEQDSDADVTSALDIKTILEKPFSPISRQAIEAARRMTEDADVLVVSGVPFGPGNLINLDLAGQALKAGKKVLLTNGIDERDYTPGKQASARVAQLLQEGAVACNTTTDLLALLPYKEIKA